MDTRELIALLLGVIVLPPILWGIWWHATRSRRQYRKLLKKTHPNMLRRRTRRK